MTNKFILFSYALVIIIGLFVLGEWGLPILFSMKTSYIAYFIPISILTIAMMAIIYCQYHHHFSNKHSTFQCNNIKLDLGVAVIILIIISAVILVFVHLRQIAENKMMVITQNMSQVLDMSVEKMIDKIALSIQANADEISREIARQQVDIKQISQHFNEQKSRLPEAENLYSFNEYGDVIYNTEKFSININISDREHFIILRDTPNINLIVTTLVVNRYTNEWIWVIACRINKSDGSFGGIVSAALLLDKINDVFSHIELNSDDSIALRDSDLSLVARFPSPKTANLVIGSKNLSIPFVNALKENIHAGTYISGATSIDNVSRIHSYRKNAKYGFIINVGISTHAALTEWNKQMWVTLCLVGVFIMTLLTFSNMIKRAWLSQEQDLNSLQISQQFLYETSKIAQLGNYCYDVQTNLWTSSDILDEILGIDLTYLRTFETWLALVIPESRSDMQAYFNMLIEQDLPFDKEYRIVRFNDGQVRWVYGKGKFQRDGQGRVLSLIGTIQDITEQKLAEIEIKTLNSTLEERVRQRTYELEASNQSLVDAKIAAEKANVAKSTFIATMSHELRTPLNAILGFSELMSLDSCTTPKQKETLAIINRSGAHLLSMINDVLDISKIEAGRLELDIRAIDLIEFLNDISVMMNIRAEAKQLNFQLNIAPNTTQFIKVDSGKLRQVLINLLGNAIKFTTTGSVVLCAKTDASTLTLQVIDSGIGIPVDKQSELFKPFVQLTQNDIDAQGTGLGLVISKSLIKLMEGKISVSSKFGAGSTFTIELPITSTNFTNVVRTEETRTVKSLAINQEVWRILVVDDNADNRLLLVSILKNIGFEVREAESGQIAIKEFEEWQPHLIWMDMRMPDMDGYEATTKIRQLKGGDKVKIIALTASAFKEQHQRILDAGCDAVLHKPIHATEIVAALANYLDVKFIYQDEEIPKQKFVVELTAKMLDELPLELRQQLHEAALQLDTEYVAEVIDNIRRITPAIADNLDKLAENYQFDQIIQKLEQ